MAGGLGRRRASGHHATRSGCRSRAHRPAGVNRPSSETPTMAWTPPTATDFRFGFEITMYVAAR